MPLLRYATWCASFGWLFAFAGYRFCLRPPHNAKLLFGSILPIILCMRDTMMFSAGIFGDELF